ncbi:MAG: molybdenum cofactor biosynthesis protein MoaE [Vulcanimicrobiaceae bacterium]
MSAPAHLRIVRTAIDPAALEEAIRSDAFGATVQFLGIVRQTDDDGHRVVGLSYEAHESMALDQFAEICAQARTRYGDIAVAVEHRIGELAIGDVAVAVVVGSAHRGAAFLACRYIIDELKAHAAIWKCERYADGTSLWRANACAQSPGEA